MVSKRVHIHILIAKCTVTVRNQWHTYFVRPLILFFEFFCLRKSVFNGQQFCKQYVSGTKLKEKSSVHLLRSKKMVKKIGEVPTLIVGTKQTKFRGVQIFGTKKNVKRFRLKMITLQTCVST